ncbi:hypothetical protein BV25DRAFT_1914942 [Artomyces pyxidatus]|uniref:Uncharacterized protein n=1 Tax=Artomyces pyxidatus TaxID=48021 RepID=A0ACB8T5B1_9AGAM|nr:hypothetical protein BV25DRAFT_1914942 [Artomyces pyxidatus]
MAYDLADIAEAQNARRRVRFCAEVHYERDPGHFLASELSVLTRSIQLASTQVNKDRDYYAVTARPESVWCYVPKMRSTWPKVTESLGCWPYRRPMTLTLVGRVVAASFKDDVGLPTPHVCSTFAPLYEADRIALYGVLDLYSDLPEAYFPFMSMTSDIRVDRYLPEDSFHQSASFVPFEAIYDGRAGYLPPGSSREMPILPTQYLLPNDIAVYAVTVDRYWLPQTDGAWRWTARLKLESITLLGHAAEISMLSTEDT